MTPLVALWLPILLSAVLVFVLSSIIHMAPLWHRSDYPKLANEAQVMDALRPLAIPPGDYMMPRPSGGQEMRSPEFLEKMKRGPVVMMTVMPGGAPSMTGNLVQWFLYCVVIALLAGYVASRALAVGAPANAVMRLVGATAFIGFAAALWQMSIWYRRAWGMTMKSTVDGVLYALATAAIFAWLWPR